MENWRLSSRVLLHLIAVQQHCDTMADHNESPASGHNQNGSGANAAIIIEDNNAAGMEAVPPNTIAFDLDVTKCKIIAVKV